MSITNRDIIREMESRGDCHEAERLQELEIFYKATVPFLRRLREPRYDSYETNDYICNSSDCKNALAALNKLDPQPITGFRFQTTCCSQCGRQFGAGDHGFSHCQQHQGK